MNTNEDLASVLGKIVSSPEFAGIVREIKGGDGTDSLDLSDEMMKKLPDVMKTVSSMFGAEDKTGADNGDSVSVPTKPDVRGALQKYDKSRAEKLLHALKPYLNSGRGEVIDKCLSVMQISDIARALGGLEGIADLLKKGGE